MTKQRDRVKMSDAEVAAMLAGNRKVQLATINPDGYPHLVTMYYALVDGKIAFWTYRTSQKALNLARDPRISCLVETGDAYFDLRGVQIQGLVETITDPDAVYEIGVAIGDVMGNPRSDASPGVDSADGADSAAINEYVANAARKRYGYVVDEDWHGHDPDAFWTNTGTVVPFLASANHYFVSASLSRDPEAPLGRLIGDLLVLRSSAWAHGGRGERLQFPVHQYSHVGGATHFDLLNHPAVYAQIADWLAAGRELPAAVSG